MTRLATPQTPYTTEPAIKTAYTPRGKLRQLKTLATYPNGYELLDNGINYFIKHAASSFNSGTFTDESKALLDWRAFEKFKAKGFYSDKATE